MNKVIFRGMVMRVYQNRDTGKVSMIISTLNATPKANFPEVFIPFALREQALNFKRGDRVTIEGRIYSKKHVREDGIVYYTQSVVADSICETERVMNEFFEGIENDGRYIKPENKVILSGKIVNLRKSCDNLVKLKIRIPNENTDRFETSVQVCYYLKDEKTKNAQELQVGADVYIVASFQTAIKENKEGKKVRYENIVAEELVVENTVENVPVLDDEEDAEPVEISVVSAEVEAEA